MPLSIRPAAPSDAAAIADIYNQGILDRAATFETDLRSAVDIEARVANQQRFPLIVAVDGEGVLGWAGLSGYSPRACYREVGIYEKHGRLDGRWLDVVIVERLIPENLR